MTSKMLLQYCVWLFANMQHNCIRNKHFFNCIPHIVHKLSKETANFIRITAKL